MKKFVITLAVMLLAGAAAITAFVEWEGPYFQETLGTGGNLTALVLFHPSRDAHFSDDLSMAVSEGFRAAGLRVVRATMTRNTPERPEGYGIVAVVSNTYYWTPDLPTLNYLARARMDGIPVLGLIGGAGSTTRSQSVLDAALRRTGATVIETRSFWLWRPNDRRRMDEPNRPVALDMARRFGLESAKSMLAGKPMPRKY